MEPLFSTEWERIEYEREQAAKRRERELRAELAELRVALAPFARYARHMRGRWGPRDDSAFYGVRSPAGVNVRYGDFRRADRVYHGEGGGDGALATRIQQEAEGGEDDGARGGGGADTQRAGAVGHGPRGGSGV